MIPSSDVDLVIVDNTDLLDKIATVLQDIPWIREVKVGIPEIVTILAYQRKCSGSEGSDRSNGDDQHYTHSNAGFRSSCV